MDQIFYSKIKADDEGNIGNEVEVTDTLMEEGVLPPFNSNT